jgi:hypothetical protein
VNDDDCALASDCCGCSAYNPEMESPGNCGDVCNINKCEEWAGIGFGFEEAICVSGMCVVEGQLCDPEEVLCDGPTPDCEDGTTPQVWDGCWTGDCLPDEACVAEGDGGGEDP